MDKRNTYTRLKLLFVNYKGQELDLEGLKTIIRINIGATERTVLACLKILGSTGLVEELGNYRFKVL